MDFTWLSLEHHRVENDKHTRRCVLNSVNWPVTPCSCTVCSDASTARLSTVFQSDKRIYQNFIWWFWHVCKTRHLMTVLLDILEPMSSARSYACAFLDSWCFTMGISVTLTRPWTLREKSEKPAKPQQNPLNAIGCPSWNCSQPPNRL